MNESILTLYFAKNQVNSNCILMRKKCENYFLKLIHFDILLAQIAIRFYFNTVTVCRKDELSLHLYSSTETLFWGEEIPFSCFQGNIITSWTIHVLSKSHDQFWQIRLFYSFSFARKYFLPYSLCIYFYEWTYFFLLSNLLTENE